MVSTMTHDAYREELFGAGLLVSTGVDGLYGTSAAFEAIVDGLGQLVGRAGAFQQATVLRFPPVMPRWVFERTDYLRSFPNLTGSVNSFFGGKREHAALLNDLAAGRDWTQALEPAEMVMCPAACHPLYPMYSGRLPATGRYYDVYGYCFRHEPSIDPARLQAFRMREYVYLGDPEVARRHRDEWVDRGLEILSGLGLQVEAVVANDPFFGRAGRLLAANQRQHALKLEIVAPVCSAEKPTAVTSCNCHGDHFAVPFGIESPDGVPAHSACVGFGVERIALALLREHGLDSARWPAGLQRQLWP